MDTKTELINCLERLQQEIRKYNPDYKEIGFNNDIIDVAAKQFKKKIGFHLDKEYLELMTKINGVFFNGMKIFPLKKHPNYDERIIEANDELREYINEDYIYYGSFDEELYCYHIESCQFHAIELSGACIWNQFSSANEMFIYMIKRGLSSVSIDL